MKKTVHENKNVTFKQFVKVIFYTIIIFISFMIVLLLGNFFPIVGNQISNKITQQNINKLYLDMPRKEVMKIIGKPFSTYHKEETEYLLYAKTYMKMSAGELEIYIYIKDDKLKGILMEFDDIGFYQCSNKKCPKILDQKIYDTSIPPT